MAIRYKRGGISTLLPGENLIGSQASFRAITGLAIPNYRVAFPSRLWSFLLRVTDRRVILDTDLFHRWTQEIGMWFPGQRPPDKNEILTEVSVQKGLFGPCLEIKSRDPGRWRWLCAPNMTLRFFFDDPEKLEKIIRDAMN